MKEENGREEGEREKGKERKGDRQRGKREIYSGTGFLSAVSLTMLCKAKVAANFQIHYVYTFTVIYDNKKKLGK